MSSALSPLSSSSGFTSSSSDSLSGSSASTSSTSSLPEIDKRKFGLAKSCTPSASSGNSSPMRADAEVGVGYVSSISNLGDPPSFDVLKAEAERSDKGGAVADKSDENDGLMLPHVVEEDLGSIGPEMVVADDCYVGEDFLGRRVEASRADGRQLGEKIFSKNGNGADVAQATGDGFMIGLKTQDAVDEGHKRGRKGAEAEEGHKRGRKGAEAEEGPSVTSVGEAEEVRLESGDLDFALEKRKKIGAERRHLGKADKIEAHNRAIDLAKSLGLSSPSDSKGDEIEAPLAMVADGHWLAEARESSHKFEECESEGLTEEVGGGMFDHGMLDEEWRQKTLALNGEEVANSIYHVPKGYRLHLPPQGSSIHHPPDGQVGVYLKDLEFGLRFLLVDEIARIIRRMGLSLGQLTTQSIRVIVAYV